jgi:hypothetical protein
VLATAFRVTVSRTHGDFPLAASAAIVCSVVFILASLGVAIIELRANRRADVPPGERMSFDDAVHSSDMQR